MSFSLDSPFKFYESKSDKIEQKVKCCLYFDVVGFYQSKQCADLVLGYF